MNAAASARPNGTCQVFISVTAIYPPAIAKAPWARFTNPISPMVSDRPTDTMYSTIAKPRPRKTMLTRASRTGSINDPPSLLALVDLLPGILDHRDRFNLGITQQAMDLFDAAKILVLDDVARL